jgi:hypothetical protein
MASQERGIGAPVVAFIGLAAFATFAFFSKDERKPEPASAANGSTAIAETGFRGASMPAVTREPTAANLSTPFRSATVAAAGTPQAVQVVLPDGSDVATLLAETLDRDRMLREKIAKDAQATLAGRLEKDPNLNETQRQSLVKIAGLLEISDDVILGSCYSLAAVAPQFAEANAKLVSIRAKIDAELDRRVDSGEITFPNDDAFLAQAAQLAAQDPEFINAKKAWQISAQQLAGMVTSGTLTAIYTDKLEPQASYFHVPK